MKKNTKMGHQNGTWRENGTGSTMSGRETGRDGKAQKVNGTGRETEMYIKRGNTSAWNWLSQITQNWPSQITQTWQ
jgi:hypothetical protein